MLFKDLLHFFFLSVFYFKVLWIIGKCSCNFVTYYVCNLVTPSEKKKNSYVPYNLL